MKIPLMGTGDRGLGRLGNTKIAMILMGSCLMLYLLAREFSMTEKGALSGIYSYRYEQLKVALKEKDAALSEALDLLEATQKAQKMQEEALDELRTKLTRYTTEIAEAQDALRKRDVALKLKEESDKMAATAVQSSQLCRQEAAAALQQKDLQMQQINGALERAKNDMSSLQMSVTRAEDRYRNTEAELNKSIKEYKFHVDRVKTQMNEHGGSVAYLAEKARMKQQHHAREIEHAKSERSCQPEIEKLTAELQGLYKWQREAVYQGCKVKRVKGTADASRRSLGEEEPLHGAAGLIKQ